MNNFISTLSNLLLLMHILSVCFYSINVLHLASFYFSWCDLFLTLALTSLGFGFSPSLFPHLHFRTLTSGDPHVQIPAAAVDGRGADGKGSLMFLLLKEVQSLLSFLISLWVLILNFFLFKFLKFLWSHLHSHPPVFLLWVWIVFWF